MGLYNFFNWLALKILTIDNLHKKHVLIIDWCCICKRGAIDYLLLHSSLATDIWSFFFTLFGIVWVMEKSVLMEC